MQRTERLSLKAHALRGRREAQGRFNYAHLDVSEAGLLNGLLEYAGGSEAERPGLAGQGWRQASSATDDRDRDREEPVSVGSRVDDGCCSAPFAQRLQHAGEGGLLVRKVDKTDA